MSRKPFTALFLGRLEALLCGGQVLQEDAVRPWSYLTSVLLEDSDTFSDSVPACLQRSLPAHREEVPGMRSSTVHNPVASHFMP